MARGGRKKRRNFGFLSCFSDPSAWDREDLEFPQDNLPLSYLTRLRSLSRTVPVVEIAGDGRGRMEVLEEMGSEEAPALISPAGNQGVGLVPRFRKFSYEEKKKIKTTIQSLAHTPLSARTHHNQQSVFCHVSTKFNYRARPLPPIRTTHPAPPQSNRPAGPAPLPSRRLDPVAGLLVVSAALAGMLFFGRLCAVLCICAWFYLFSFIRPAAAAEEAAPPPETVVEGAEEVDVDSPEYKKKVVLMGLLERNRYGGSGIPVTPVASPATAGMRSPW